MLRVQKGFFSLFSSKCKRVRPVAIKGSKTYTGKNQKAKANNRQKSLCYPTELAFYDLFYFSFIIIITFYFLFYFSSLVQFTLFYLFDFIVWFSLFFFSYSILISLSSLHLYSHNTLLFFFYFLFFLFRSYASCHIIEVPIPTQHPSLVLVHFTIFLSFITAVVNFILSHSAPSFYPLISRHLTI